MVTKTIATIEFTIDEVGINCVSTVEFSRVFGRPHAGILRQVRVLRDDGRLVDALSAPTSYLDSQNKKMPMHLSIGIHCNQRSKL